MKSPSSTAHVEDIERLRRCLVESEKRLTRATAELAEKDRIIAEKDQTIANKIQLIDKYESTIADLVQRKWGRSSEKHPGQGELSLFNEAELAALQAPLDENDASENEPAEPGVDGASSENNHGDKTRSGTPRKPPRPWVLPDHLERVKVTYDLDANAPVCPHGGQWAQIGEEVSEQLGIIPARQFVIQHIKLKYACSCKHCGVKTAAMPVQPIPGSQASAGLISYTAVSKLHDGLPLYRQQAMWKREGLDLPRSKLARWLISAGLLLQPLYNLMQDILFDYDIVLSDETGIQVLKEDGRSASSKSALWIRRGGAPETPVVLLDYNVSKGSAVVCELLDQCSGYLVSDAASCFDKVVSDNNLKRVLCNDHARRRFVKTAAKAPKSGKNTAIPPTWIAVKGINFYKHLYRIEHNIRNLPPDKKYEHRQKKAVPVWDAFMSWAKEVHCAGVRHHKTRDALNYLIRHEAELRRYCDDGRLPISNIKSEHVAKTVAVARKNFLFADTVAGAQSSALLYSVLESAKANGHNPHHYMTAVLAQVPNAQSVEQIEALLPWRLTAEQAERLYRQQPSPFFEKNQS